MKPIVITQPNHFILSREDFESLFCILSPQERAEIWNYYLEHFIDEGQEGVSAHAVVHAIVINELIHEVFNDRVLVNHEIALSAALMLSKFGGKELTPEKICSLSTEFAKIIRSLCKGDIITFEEVRPWANDLAFKHREELAKVQNN